MAATSGVRAGVRIALAALIAVSVVLASSPRTEAQSTGTPGVWLLGFWPTLPPGDLLEFRLALAHGIDRAAVARAASPHASQGVTLPAGTIEHPSLPGYTSTVRGQTFDPAKARELFERSGWTRPISILTTRTTSNWILAIENAVSASLLASTGATISFAKVASFEVLISSARAGNVPIWLYGWTSSSYSMPLGFARAYYMSDPEIRALVERGAAQELEQLLLDRALIIPIVFYRSR